MQSSSKGTVFETSIPFQLAFFALIEHDTDVAPLWDPVSRSFVGLVTLSDYLSSLRLCHSLSLSATDLTSQTLSDILATTPHVLKHHHFPHLEAEEHVLSLCHLLSGEPGRERERDREGADYVCILDPDTQSLVSILGPLDVLHLLGCIARANETLFSVTLRALNLGLWGDDVVTVPESMPLGEALQILERVPDLECLPVTGERERVVGLCHRGDVSVCVKAESADVAVTHLTKYMLKEALDIRSQLLSTGELLSVYQPLVTVTERETVSVVLTSMVMSRSHTVVVVDDQGRAKGIVHFKHILRWCLQR